MKKILIAMLGLALVASVATAGVAINWTVTYGAYTHDAPNTTDDPSAFQLLNSYSALWQLIYAGPDNLANAPTMMNPGGGWVSGDDVVWAQREINVGGGPAGDSTTWTDWMTRDTGITNYEDPAWSLAGSVYQRVYETTTYGTVTAGDWYYESPLLTLNTGWSPPSNAQDFFLDDGNGGFQANTVIPEPATMSLLGLGALVMALRRRRA